MSIGIIRPLIGVIVADKVLDILGRHINPRKPRKKKKTRRRR